MRFAEPSLRHPHRQTPDGNELDLLSISCDDTANIRALISSIALQRGEAQEIYLRNKEELAGITSGISIEHLPNLLSLIFMEYELDMNRSQGNFDWQSRMGVSHTKVPLPHRPPSESSPCSRSQVFKNSALNAMDQRSSSSACRLSLLSRCLLLVVVPRCHSIPLCYRIRQLLLD